MILFNLLIEVYLLPKQDICTLELLDISTLRWQ